MEVQQTAFSDQKYDAVSVVDIGLTVTPSSEKASGKSEKTSGKSGKTARDIWWSNVNFTAGNAKILTGCWGHVSAPNALVVVVLHLYGGCNVQVQSGKVCAILGPSGAGKSSLLNVLAGRSSSNKTVKVDGLVSLFLNLKCVQLMLLMHPSLITER